MNEPLNYTDIKNIDLNQFIKGIDLSHNNGAITSVTWNIIKGLGIEFVYHKLTEGMHMSDPNCIPNIKIAKQAGFKIGYYHFCHPEIDIIRQISNVKNNLSLVPIADLPLVLDYEESATSPQDNLDYIQAFIKAFPGCIIYSTADFLNNHLPKNHGLTQKLWIARYNFDYNSLKMPDGWDDFKIWQFTSKGKINGKNYDLNLMKK